MALFGKKSDKEDKKAKTPVAEVNTAPSQDFSLNLPMVLIQPRISEKARGLAKLNKYIFMVKKAANKVEVKKAVEKQYSVKVVNVNMINTQGKVKNFGRIAGKTAPIKKAVVTLKQGESIKGLTDVA